MKVAPDRLEFNSTVKFIAGGSKHQTVSKSIINDVVALEDNELVNVSLIIQSPASGVILGQFPTTLVTIVDDDCKFSNV